MKWNSSNWKKIQIGLLLSKSVLWAPKVFQSLLHLQREKKKKKETRQKSPLHEVQSILDLPSSKLSFMNPLLDQHSA